MNDIELIQNLKYEIDKSPQDKFSLISDTDTNTAFCYKHQPLIDVESVLIRPEPVKFALFDMYLLESLSILSAYVFIVPGYNVNISDYYVKLIQPSATLLKKFNNVKLVMQDNRLNIFHSDDGAALISVNGLKEVIKPNMIRKSEKNRED